MNSEASPTYNPGQVSLVDAVFFGYAHARMDKARAEMREFAHYTSSEGALSIINNGEIWLRNSAVMNDYSEIAHGEACLKFVLEGDNPTRRRSEALLNQLEPGLHGWLAAQAAQGAVKRRVHTFLASISEHGPERIGPGVLLSDPEYTLGRLSMWRAYGSRGGVALVFKQDPLFTTEGRVGAYSAPVWYGMPQDFTLEWERMLSRVETNLDGLRKVPATLVRDCLAQLAHFSTLSCKHPGFSEEREWRITYSADPMAEGFDDGTFNATHAVQREFRCVNGVPQRLYKLPLRDVPEHGVEGLKLADCLTRVIIGPTEYPTVVYDALYSALISVGVPNPGLILSVSEIPLRT